MGQCTHHGLFADCTKPAVLDSKCKDHCDKAKLALLTASKEVLTWHGTELPEWKKLRRAIKVVEEG